MTSRMQQRRDTAANWTSNNPTLAAGELGLETDTGKSRSVQVLLLGLLLPTQQLEQLLA